MIADALCRLGWAGIGIGSLLALGFAITATPYVAPYTTWAWGLGFSGIVLLVTGELMKE